MGYVCEDALAIQRRIKELRTESEYTIIGVDLARSPDINTQFILYDGLDVARLAHDMVKSFDAYFAQEVAYKVTIDRTPPEHGPFTPRRDVWLLPLDKKEEPVLIEQVEVVR